MTYEDILETVGEFGPWQIQQLFLLWVPILVCGAQLQILDRVLVNPEELFCSIADCEDHGSEVFLDTDVLDLARDHYQAIWPAARKLSMRAIEDNSGIEMNIAEDFCTIFIPKVINGRCFWNKTQQKNSPVYSCTGHQEIKYKMTKFHKDSVITEFDLVCSDHYKGVILRSLVYIGGFCGCLFFSVLSHHSGRKSSLLVAMLMLLVSGLTMARMKTVELLGFFIFLIGFSTAGLYLVTFLLLLDMQGYKKHFKKLPWICYNSVIMNLLLIPFFTGHYLASYIAQHFPDSSWQSFQTSCTLLSSIQLISLYFIQPSARWLGSRGKSREAKCLLDQMNKANREDCDLKLIGVQEDSEQDIAMMFEETSGDANLFTMEKMVNVAFKATNSKKTKNDVMDNTSIAHSVVLQDLVSVQLIQQSVCLGFCWMVIFFTDITISNSIHNWSRSANELPTTRLQICIIKISACFFSVIFEGLFGRRFLFSISLFLGSLLSAMDSFQHMRHDSMKFIGLLTCFPNTCAMSLLWSFTVEVYPINIRAQAVGIFAALGQVGGAFTPLKVFADIDRNDNHDDELNVVGLLLFFAACLAFYLPETVGCPLPASVDDVLFMRTRNYPFFGRIRFVEHTEFLDKDVKTQEELEREDEIEKELERAKLRALLKKVRWADGPTEDIRRCRTEKFGVDFLKQRCEGNTGE